MLRIGIVRLLALLVFGLLVPFALCQLRRRIGLWSVLIATLVIGVGYGALKADNPWSDQGLASNLALMATSGIAVLGYVAISVSAAALIAKAVSK
jgi:hypothetical protein